jgi:hypothetical protein
MSTIEPMIEPPAGYVPDAVERIGRRLKLEYFGMTSVFVVVGLLFFGGLTDWKEQLAATGAIYFLFQGLKKKTKDHIVASLLMFTASAVAYPAIATANWAFPFLFFAFGFWAGEGFLEGRTSRVYGLPAVFGLWAWMATDPSWILGLLVVAAYLAYPWESDLRRRLLVVVGASVVVSMLVAFFRPGFAAFALGERLPLGLPQFGLLALIAIPTALALIFYWSRLENPRKWNALICGLLAPWDLRLLAVFALAACIAMAATIFRRSADSERIRALLKHAEWYFFWVVVAMAVWLLGGFLA